MWNRFFGIGCLLVGATLINMWQKLHIGMILIGSIVIAEREIVIK